MTADESVKFLTVSTDNFIQAIADEEFTRDDLVSNKLLVVAEGLRRTGRDALAMDWYLALSQVIETQPKRIDCDDRGCRCATGRSAHVPSINGDRGDPCAGPDDFENLLSVAVG